MEDKNYARRTNTALIIASIVILLVYIGYPFIVTVFFDNEWEQIGQFGDSYGSINSLFTGSTLLLLIYTVLMQRVELKYTIEEFRRSATAQEQSHQALRMQAETLKIQQFENTFFKLLEIQLHICNELSYNSKEKGKKTFSMMSNTISNFSRTRPDLIKEHFNAFNDYINNLKNIFKFIDTEYPKEEKLKKVKYFGFVFGQFTSAEWNVFNYYIKKHLMKKIVFYLYDLLRDKISLDEFIQTAGAAVRTSLKTNIRSIYQSWVYVNILILLSQYGGTMIYPELRYLILGRSGKQKSGEIPPNAVIYLDGKGYLSFFLEAPRPISWEDSGDLRKIWTLYTALRPDILVYTRKILNIVDLKSNPPIIRPDIIIECKELEDWYKRGREVRGPFARPLSVEEWRSKWISGLWDGLADALGVTRKKITEEIKDRRALRLKDIQIVTLYYKLYKPKVMFLVSRAPVPKEIKKYLRERGLRVIDNVGFNRSKLKPIANELYKRAKRDVTDYELIELNGEELTLLDKLIRILREKHRYGEITTKDAIRFALKFTLRNKDLIPKLLESKSQNV